MEAIEDTFMPNCGKSCGGQGSCVLSAGHPGPHFCPGVGDA